MEIFIDTVIESVALGQTIDYTVSVYIFYKFVDCLKKFQVYLNLFNVYLI